MSHPIASYQVQGSPPNISLERLDSMGKAISARPASPEELEMYNLLQQLWDQGLAQQEQIQIAKRRAQDAIKRCEQLAQAIGELKAENGELS